MIKIDGISYDVKAEVRRTAKIKSSDISGDLMDGSYFNDVLGTYMFYSIVLKYPLYDQDKYSALFEVLTLPVDGHVFVLPYNQGEITVTARVESVPDEYVEMDSGRKYWKALAFDIISNAPSKSMSLGQVILRGRTPMPENTTPEQGIMYTWDGTKWVVTSPYANADNISY